jgi:SAM-dependent methyltransferase
MASLCLVDMHPGGGTELKEHDHDPLFGEPSLAKRDAGFCDKRTSETSVVVNRALNYGRHHIRNFLHAAAPYHAILDIGAARGDDLALAREVQPDAQLDAIEINQEYAEHLVGKGIAVHNIDVERDTFPFPNKSVDVILANQIMEHVKELFWIFHEISRVLRDDGSLIMGVPNLASLHNRLLLMCGRQPTSLQNASAHVRGYTKSDILRTLAAAFPGGYALRNFGGSNFYPFPPVLARPLAAIFPEMAWGIFLRLEKQRPYDREFLEFPVRAQLETTFFLG